VGPIVDSKHIKDQFFTSMCARERDSEACLTYCRYHCSSERSQMQDDDDDDSVNDDLLSKWKSISPVNND